MVPNRTELCSVEQDRVRFLMFNCFLLGSTLPIGISANLLVFFVAFRSRTLRAGKLALQVNLAAADFLRCFLDCPLFLTSLLLEDFNSGSVVCVVQQGTYSLCTCVQFLTVVAISVDRYQAVAFPFRTDKRKERIQVWISLIWLGGFFTAVLSLTLCKEAKSYMMCQRFYSEDLPVAGADPFGSYVLVPIWICSVVLIVVHYTRIFLIVRQHNNKIFDMGVMLKPHPSHVHAPCQSKCGDGCQSKWSHHSGEGYQSKCPRLVGEGCHSKSPQLPGNVCQSQFLHLHREECQSKCLQLPGNGCRSEHPQLSKEESWSKCPHIFREGCQSKCPHLPDEGCQSKFPHLVGKGSQSKWPQLLEEGWQSVCPNQPAEGRQCRCPPLPQEGCQSTFPQLPEEIVGAVCVLTPRAKEIGKKRMEGKLAKRFGYIIITIILFWIPLVLMLMLSGFVDAQSCKWVMQEMETSALVVTCLPSAVDPLIYTLLHQKFRTEFHKLFSTTWTRRLFDTFTNSALCCRPKNGVKV